MYNPDKHHRRSIRLRDYNYANTGAYFVTVCLNKRISVQMQRYVVGKPRCKMGRQYVAKGQTHRSAPTVPYFDFPTLGTIENGVMVLNEPGKMVEKYILEIVNNADKFSNIKIDEHIIMPDHIHAIIKIVGADLRVCPISPRNHRINDKSVQLGTVIQWLKTMTTNEYANNVKTANWHPFNKKLWQRNYHEHVIRNEMEYARIAKYIRNNPILWGKPKTH